MMPTRLGASRTPTALGALLLVAVGVAAWWVARPRPETVRATLSAVDVLADADAEGYLRPASGRPIRFPADHAPHPAFRDEWWYLTGNLEAGGRRIGYQLVIFRSALAPPRPDAAVDSARDAQAVDPVGAPPISAWATDQAWMAHLAVTDPEGIGFREAERLARGALGLAGAEGMGALGGAPDAPLRVHVASWEMAGGAGGDFPVRVRAADGPVALDLHLAAVKPPVLHGEEGYHAKDAAAASASHYYSLPRLRTTGTVVLGADTLSVEGLSWLDREWSSGALPPGVEGWDWMGLQLADGRDLMLYRLRGARGAAAGGTLVRADGTALPLGAGDLTLEVRDTWESPLDGAAYPSEWRVRVPAEGLDLTVRPILAAQELNLTYRYWEGAVDVRRAASGAEAGWGYLEMTGYGGAAAGGAERPPG